MGQRTRQHVVQHRQHMLHGVLLCDVAEHCQKCLYMCGTLLRTTELSGQELHMTQPNILSLSLHEEEGKHVAPPRRLRALMLQARQKVFAD